MTLDQLQKQGVAFLEHTLPRAGQIQTTLFALTEANGLKLFHMPHYAENRDVCRGLLRNLFRERGVIAYTACTEAWYAERPTATGIVIDGSGRLCTDLPPSEDANRIEVVIASTIGLERILTTMFRIDRTQRRPRVGKEIFNHSEPTKPRHLIGLGGLLPAHCPDPRPDASSAFGGRN